MFPQIAQYSYDGSTGYFNLNANYFYATWNKKSPISEIFLCFFRVKKTNKCKIAKTCTNTIGLGNILMFHSFFSIKNRCMFQINLWQWNEKKSRSMLNGWVNVSYWDDALKGFYEKIFDWMLLLDSQELQIAQWNWINKHSTCDIKKWICTADTKKAIFVFYSDAICKTFGGAWKCQDPKQFIFCTERVLSSAF